MSVNIYLLNKAIGVIGCSGMDRLLSFDIVNGLSNLTAFYRKEVTTEKTAILEQLHDKLSPDWEF